METALIEAFGARLEVVAPRAEDLQAIAAAIPRAVLSRSARSADHRVVVEPSRGGLAVRDGERETWFADAPAALAEAASRLHFLVAVHARDAVFLHAGAVWFEQRMIVIPGATHAGKSTLTAALVAAGGEYYSDEFAPVDGRGRIVPYRKSPSLRPGSPVSGELTVDGPEPPARRCDLVLGCEFRPGAAWDPERLTDGQGALLLVANTVVAQTRPSATARAVAAVMRSASAYRTARPTAALAVEGIRTLIGELALPAGTGA